MLHLFKPGGVSGSNCWLLSFKTVSQLWTAWGQGCWPGTCVCKWPEELGVWCGVFIYCFSEECPLGVSAREENALLEGKCCEMESHFFSLWCLFSCFQYFLSFPVKIWILPVVSSFHNSEMLDICTFYVSFLDLAVGFPSRRAVRSETSPADLGRAPEWLEAVDKSNWNFL